MLISRSRRRSLLLWLSLAATVGSVSPALAKPTAPEVWTLTSWERALRSTPPAPLRPAVLHAARGETESFQIAIRGPRPLRVESLRVDPPRGPGGAAIPRDAIRLWRAHQLRIDTGTYRNDEFQPDCYPDALIPARLPVASPETSEVRFRALPFDLPANQTHTFWIDLRVPRDAPAGVWNGGVEVRCASAGAVSVSVSVPVELHVWPFTLPRTPALRTAFGSPASRIERWYRERAARGGVPERPDAARLATRCARLMADYRLDAAPPGDLLSVRPDATGAFRLDAAKLERWRQFLQEYAPGSVSLPSPTRYFHDPVGDAGRVGRYLKSWEAVFDGIKRRDVLLWIYLRDEPNDREAYEFVRSWGRAIHKAGSRVRVLVTEQTTPQDAAWGNLYGAVDIWVPLFSLFDPRAARARRELGESIWTYTALCQRRPTPWWHTDQPLLNYRIAAWIAWLNHEEGLLYWGGAAYWRGVEDPWSDPATYRVGREGEGGGVKRFNGEGSLLYPARDVGFHGAVPSMRLAALRDGIDDYDWLSLLDRLGRRPAAEAMVRAVARDWYDWTREPLIAYHTRRKLGCLIRDAQARAPSR